MKQILFFATKEDLAAVLHKVEHATELKYVRMGNFTQPIIEEYLDGEHIPNMGMASSDSTAACEAFLMSRRNLTIKQEYFLGGSGIPRYLVDQRLNPDTVELNAGGLWNHDVLLHGRIATVSQSSASQDLMKAFDAAIKKQFRKIKAFYVGKSAYELLQSGIRLSSSARSPKEYDLTEE